MANNPDPARITAALWRFWEEFNRFYPPVLLSGIYANKSGYHNTRSANSSGNYSVRDAIDRQGPSDKSAAIDLTFPDAQAGAFSSIARFSKRLLDAGRRRDPRLYRGGEAILREFYGNADLDREVEGWDFRYHRPVSSDTSHLWHIHISVTRKYVTDWPALAGVLAVLRGDPIDEEDDMPLTTKDVELILDTRFGSPTLGVEEKPVRWWLKRGARAAAETIQVQGEVSELRGQVAGLTVLVQQLLTADPVQLTPDQLELLGDRIAAASAGAAAEVLARLEAAGQALTDDDDI